jgi:hypothetical protein
MQNYTVCKAVDEIYLLMEYIMMMIMLLCAKSSSAYVQKIIYEIKDTLYYSKIQLIFILIKKVTHTDRVYLTVRKKKCAP